MSILRDFLKHEEDINYYGGCGVYNVHDTVQLVDGTIFQIGVFMEIDDEPYMEGNKYIPLEEAAALYNGLVVDDIKHKHTHPTAKELVHVDHSEDVKVSSIMKPVILLHVDYGDDTLEKQIKLYVTNQELGVENTFSEYEGSEYSADEEDDDEVFDDDGECDCSESEDEMDVDEPEDDIIQSDEETEDGYETDNDSTKCMEYTPVGMDETPVADHEQGYLEMLVDKHIIKDIYFYQYVITDEHNFETAPPPYNR